ncbi:MAG: YggS family pyridoxal phosphate-dependent enzyme [Oscillospiraceae bacterium]|nr:YggS family pyridoxal phosphate-dependent enzyme [Oscillospiraceae bacterium]
MALAAEKAGRDPKEILRFAATKMNDSARVRAAVEAGVDVCGENRVQELVQKSLENAYAPAPVHFIGHLQTNKVNKVVGKVDLIQSVDRLELLEALQKTAQKMEITQDILLEVNIGGEESKSGFAPQDVMDMVARMEAYPALRLRGLMTIPPVATFSGENRRFFAEMHRLSVDIRAKKYDNVSMDYLSMGMSDDFADAIMEGSTMIRVGTRIFGARTYTK